MDRSDYTSSWWGPVCTRFHGIQSVVVHTFLSNSKCEPRGDAEGKVRKNLAINIRTGAKWTNRLILVSQENCVAENHKSELRAQPTTKVAQHIIIHSASLEVKSLWLFILMKNEYLTLLCILN